MADQELNANDKYDQVFVESFSLGREDLAKNPTYSETDHWDSVGHMTMISSLEDKFGIALDTEDIIDFSSYQKGKTILAKYGVVLN